MSNPFEALANSQIVQPVKARMQATETRREKQVEKELHDEQKLNKMHRRWRKEKLQALLDGPHGKNVRQLIHFLNTMTLSSAPPLLRLVESGVWLHELSDDERFDLLQIIGNRIVKMREKAGIEPFDDGLPGDEPKAFEVIKTMMRVR